MGGGGPFTERPKRRHSPKSGWRLIAHTVQCPDGGYRVWKVPGTRGEVTFGLRSGSGTPGGPEGRRIGLPPRASPRWSLCRPESLAARGWSRPRSPLGWVPSLDEADGVAGLVADPPPARPNPLVSAGDSTPTNYGRSSGPAGLQGRGSRRPRRRVRWRSQPRGDFFVMPPGSYRRLYPCGTGKGDAFVAMWLRTVKRKRE